MKLYLYAVLLAAAAASGSTGAADVGVSVSIGEPGFYGRLELGDYPPPQVLYRQPVLIERGAARRAPIYLHVPPGHVKNWRKHCRAYNACDERVFFVRNNWYNREYVPRYQNRHGNRPPEQHNDARDDRRGNDQNGHPSGGHDRGRNH